MIFASSPSHKVSLPREKGTALKIKLDMAHNVQIDIILSKNKKCQTWKKDSKDRKPLKRKTEDQRPQHKQSLT